MAFKYDFLVIGSGLAGASFALKVADFGKVAIISKSSLDETNTSYAQGGIAAVINKPDSFENTPLATPILKVNITVAPKKPPEAAVGVKACLKMSIRAAGIYSSFISIIRSAPPI